MAQPLVLATQEAFEKALQEWEHSAPVHTSLPVHFQNGAVFSSFVGECKGCGHPIEDELLRGRVTRPIPELAALDAYGACKSCRLITPFMCRVRSTPEGLQMEWIHERHGWVTALMNRPGVLGRFKGLLHRLFAFRER